MDFADTNTHTDKDTDKNTDTNINMAVDGKVSESEAEQLTNYNGQLLCAMSSSSHLPFRLS